MKLKITYNSETHILQQIPNKYEDLIYRIQEIYAEKLTENFAIYYIDFEDDKIFITSTGDLQLFLNEDSDQTETKSKCLRIYIACENQPESKKEPIVLQEKNTQEITEQIKKQVLQEIKEELKMQKQPERDQEKIIHNKYTCDGCGMHPIIGIRYKCSVCPDFDYCEKCEADKEHIHPFLKIRNPKQSPKVLFTMVNDGTEEWVEEEEEKKQGCNYHSFNCHNHNYWQKLHPNKIRECFQNFIRNCDQSIFGNLFAHQNQPSQQPQNYQIQIIGEPTITPSIITPETEQIYITLEIKNIGNNMPSVLKVESEESLFEPVKIMKLEPNQQIPITIILPGGYEAGAYSHNLKLTCEENQNKVTLVQFPINFTVNDEKKIEENQNKLILELAKQLIEISGLDLEQCIEFVRNNQGLGIHELANKLLE